MIDYRRARALSQIKPAHRQPHASLRGLARGLPNPVATPRAKRVLCWPRVCFHRGSPVGASLLAIAVLHPTSMPPDLPPSRASSLPQGMVFSTLSW
ncbi:hypothetical protein FHK92_04685 [Pseudomonas brassicacearum subsp. neoaurantiaca]|uniref:Uncharacterized protein n=1 Tax=Pseudomonas brassicacearum subsp. neoaurantiaca TaxID=494916 RepID=A0A7V8RJW8_9PSED|nr:hypothetical protein [Pseudomonas brassicacearum subsp. neoaurantiaca]